MALRYLEANIDNVGAYATCAWTLAADGRLPEAKDVIRRGVKLDRGHPGVRLVSALCNLADGSDPEAKEVAQLTSILDDESYGYVKLELLRLGRLPLDRKS